MATKIDRVMRSSRMRVTTAGFSRFADVLARLPAEVKAKAVPKALDAAAKPIVERARAIAPKRTGALKRSITHVVRTYPSGESAAIIGPDTDYYGGGKRLKKTDDRRGSDRPSKYAHLVEFGHAVKGGGTVAAKPFLRPGIEAGSTEAGDAFGVALAQGIEEVATKEAQR